MNNKVKVIEDFILDVLYGDNGLIKQYVYKIDEDGKLED